MKKIKSESFFIFLLFIFTGVVIFLLTNNSQYSTPAISNITAADINKDAITSIMGATDNAINKIYNIIVIVTVYITVIITTFSLFQYIKSKEIETTKQELHDNIIELKNKIDENRQVLNSEFDNKIIEMNSILEKVKHEALTTSNKTRIDLLEMKAEIEKSKKNYYNDENAIKAYKEIIEIVNNYPDIISKSRIGDIYHYYAMLMEYREVQEAENYYNKAIDNFNDDISKSYSYGNLGMLKHRGKYYNKAIELLEKSLKLYELNLLPQENLIISLDRRNNEGDVDKAFTLLKNLRSQNEFDAAKSFFKLLGEIKLPNVEKKYSTEINAIKDNYIHTYPELVSAPKYVMS